MKIRFRSGLVLLVLLGASLATPAIAMPIAWWRFDEAGGSVAFASIGSVNGNLAGTATFVSGGVSGNALAFTRANGDYVSMGNNFGLSGPFSIAMWVMTTSFNQQAADTIMLSKHDGGSINGYFVGMNTSAGYGATDKAYFYTAPSVGQEATSTTSVNDGNWHLVVSVFDSGTARIFVDSGPAEDVSSGLSVGGNAPAEFLVGGVWLSGAPTARFDGFIDEVQIYDMALSQAEVEFLLNNPGEVVPEPTPALLLVAGLTGLAAAGRRRSRRWRRA
jgi:hypothetical protein